jgi:DNA-binding NarL/FixJ family response regulator
MQNLQIKWFKSRFHNKCEEDFFVRKTPQNFGIIIKICIFISLNLLLNSLKMTPKTLTCVIVDDEPVSLETLTDYVSKISTLTLNASFANPQDALPFLLKNPTDLLITAVNMPQLSGIDLYSAIRNETNTQVIFISGYPEKILEAMNYPNTDCIQKPVTLWRFEYAIQKALAAASYERKHYEHIPAEYLENALKNAPLLSKKEREIMKLIREGYSSSKISEMLFVAPKTIENHRTHIRAKLGILPEHSLTETAHFLDEKRK